VRFELTEPEGSTVFKTAPFDRSGTPPRGKQCRSVGGTEVAGVAEFTPVNLHMDIPTRAQVGRLLDHRRPASVSIYVPTDPVSDGGAERIELGNLASEAERQLVEAGADKADVAEIREELDALVDDDEFWRYKARSLAIFATPEAATTFRLPNHLVAMVEVSDRFHVKPLLRAITFPEALVLALAQGSVRLIEVAPNVQPAQVRVPVPTPRRAGHCWKP
jgi:hypothetical protein